MSTKCLSCDNRYRLFDIVLHVLVMWGRQLNSSSMIMPRCRCSWTCSMWLSLRLRLRISGRSWCFCLVASSILFVFAGCKIIAFLSHQSDTSFMLFCNSFWTVAVFLSDAFSDVSSANISQFTESLVICKGRSLIKIQKRRRPRIEPWGIPYRIMPPVDSSPFMLTICGLRSK